MNRSLFYLAMLLCIALAAPAQATQNPLGLTARQLRQLKAMSMTLVAPSWVPSGFVRRPVQVDPQNKRYVIQYVGRDGSRLIFEGSTSLAKSNAAPARIHHGFFSKVTSSIGNIFNRQPKQNSTTASNVSGEEEADPSQMDVVADSRLIGPAHFKPSQQGCAAGESQTGIAPAKYTLTGCKVVADNLIRVYRSATKVALH